MDTKKTVSAYTGKSANILVGRLEHDLAQIKTTVLWAMSSYTTFWSIFDSVLEKAIW